MNTPYVRSLVAELLWAHRLSTELQLMGYHETARSALQIATRAVERIRAECPETPVGEVIDATFFGTAEEPSRAQGTNLFHV